MKIFAISDPHLSFGTNKPMDVFGPQWKDHAARLRDNWLATVGAEDLVLVAGDVSWGMRLPDALPDLRWLAELPGRKVFIKGNHDYWWSSLKKVSAVAGAGMLFLQNNALLIEGVAIGGSRLWDYPFVRWPGSVAVGEKPAATGAVVAPPAEPDQDGHAEVDAEKVRRNELSRLQASLALFAPEARYRICMTHFPPVSRDPERNELTALIAAAKTDLCVYGHLHALDRAQNLPAADCVVDGVRYVLTSADWLDFRPRQLHEL